MNKKTLAFIVGDAIFLSVGIMLILISSIRYDNWFPLLTIFVHCFAIFIPTFCPGGCSMEEDNVWGDEDVSASPAAIAWILLGIFIVVGYAIPVELFRTNSLSEKGVYFTLTGSTTILAAVLIFVRLIYFQKDDFSVYLF